MVPAMNASRLPRPKSRRVARMVSARGLRAPAAGLVLAVGLVLAAAAPAVAQDDTLQIDIDKSRLMKLPAGVATVVIGNPAIADGIVQSGGVMVLTGKSYGTTNLVALDSAGAVLLDRDVSVLRRTAGSDVVTVYRGAEGSRQALSCAPRCEPLLNIGDAAVLFDTTFKQINDRNTVAAPR